MYDSSEALLFVGMHGGAVTDRPYLRVFHEATASAFIPEEAASPLMGVPYSLRHPAVSTWLRTTSDPAQVAALSDVGNRINPILRCHDLGLHPRAQGAPNISPSGRSKHAALPPRRTASAKAAIRVPAEIQIVVAKSW
jgi:hypothetical protein